MAALEGLTSSLTERPWPYLTPAPLAAGLVAMLLVAAAYAAMRLDAGQEEWRGIEHGSARWATRRELAPYADARDFSNNMILAKGVYMRYQGQPRSRRYSKNNNVLLVAGSGRGKSIWTALQLMQAHSSYLLTDPKGETLARMAGYLERRGYEVRVLNTASPELTLHRYNPFAYIRSTADIYKFAVMFMGVTTGDAQKAEAIWENSDNMLIAAYVAFMFERLRPEERTMGTLCLIHDCADVQEQEGYVSVLDELFEQLREDVEARRAAGELPPGYESYALTLYEGFKKGASRTMQSVLISVSSRLAPFAVPEVRAMTEVDEMDLEEMGERRVLLGAVIDDIDPAFSFIATMLESQAMTVLSRKADLSPGRRLKVPVQLLLDEARNIGKIPNLDKLVAVARSRGISVVMGLQSLAQLEAVYGKDAMQTMLDCADTVVYLGGGRSEATTDAVSGWAGQATIDTRSVSSGKGAAAQATVSHQRAGRALLGQDEVARLSAGEALIHITGEHTYVGPAYDLAAHPGYKDTGYASGEEYRINKEPGVAWHAAMAWPGAPMWPGKEEE